MTGDPRPAAVTVLVQPGNKTHHLPKACSVLAVLGRLGLTRTQALVIRDGELLTPDVMLKRGDSVTVRKVTSAG